MLTPNEKKIIATHLKECENVHEMFKLLQNTFDLRECTPGSTVKAMFVEGIMQGITVLNPPLK